MLGIGAVSVKDRLRDSRNCNVYLHFEQSARVVRIQSAHGSFSNPLHCQYVDRGRRCDRRNAGLDVLQPGLPHNAAAMNENDGFDEVRARRVASPLRPGLAQWLRSPAGVDLLRAEMDRVHGAVGNLFGYHCLQVGDLAGADLMSASRILGRAVVDIDGCAPRGTYPLVTGAATSLPVDSHAVDVVLLPHVLEFEMRPHDALREASRVLVPEGCLVVLAFNPVSAIGLRRIFKYRTASAPWCGTFFGSARLRDWLTLLGLDIVDQRPCFPSRHARRDWRPGIRSFAEWMPPALASAALIVAKKRDGGWPASGLRVRP